MRDHTRGPKQVIVTFNKDIFETKGRNKKRRDIFLEGHNYFGILLKDGILKAFSVVHNDYIPVSLDDVTILSEYEARTQKNLYMSLLEV